jgi:ERF superfamily
MNQSSQLIVPPEKKAPVPAYSPPSTELNPLQMLSIAVSKGIDGEQLARFMDLADRWEKNEARKAFVADMAEFKKNPPTIYKNKHVGFDSRRTESRTDYDHATHAEVTYKIIAGLAQHGFSHRWVTTQPDGKVQVECIITHRLGHFESLSMVAPPDNSGNKSPVQAIASTKTLLERYTLLGATGLSTMDLPDADDRTDDPAEDSLKVPAAVDGHKPYTEWKADMRALADEGKARLQPAWLKSPETYRNHATTIDKAWWEDCKAVAAKVKT